jgi:hypothetical protein
MLKNPKLTTGNNITYGGPMGSMDRTTGMVFNAVFAFA